MARGPLAEVGRFVDQHRVDRLGVRTNERAHVPDDVGQLGVMEQRLVLVEELDFKLKLKLNRKSKNVKRVQNQLFFFF